MTDTSYLTISKFFEFIDRRTPPMFNHDTMLIIGCIINSILFAEECISQIDPATPDGKEILELEGMTGTKTRHLYNNICSNLTSVKYLEIGTWNGSSSVSAIYKNNIDAVFIDNWCQFGGTSEVFQKNITKFNSDSRFSLVESDCWKVDLSKIGPFNVYLYDGDHTELDHFKALEYYLPVLEPDFVFLVDDWNWPEVRDGTMRAIRELDLTIKFRHEIFVSSEEIKNSPYHKGRETWWNGCGVFLLSKKI